MKSFKQFLKEANETSKYQKGDFGYWWTVEEGNEDIEGKVYNGDISGFVHNLTSLKGAPKEVKGDFDCSHNNLTSLKGAPEKVKGYFDCNNNNLTSLEYAPKEVGDKFNCSHNNLTSLKGAPKKVGDFYCGFNNLTSLEYAPKEVKGDFYCYTNKLITLKGCPKKVGDNFECSYNNLTSLKDGPEKVGGDFDCSNNDLTTLEYAPKEVGIDFDCKNNRKLKSLEGIGKVKGKIFTNVKDIERNFIGLIQKVFKDAEEMDDNVIILDRKEKYTEGFDYVTVNLTMEKISPSKVNVMFEILDDEGNNIHELSEYEEEIEITYKNTSDLLKQLKLIQAKFKNIVKTL